MISEVSIKFIRSDERTFVFGSKNDDEYDWAITELIGIDTPDFEILTQDKSIGDGTIVTGTYVGGRSIDITASVKNRSLNDVLRAIAIQFFNKKYTFKVYITYMGVQRWIEGIIDGFSCPSENVFKPVQASMTIYCQEPYFKSVDNFGKNIATLRAMFGFPYIQTNKIKVVTAAYNYARNVYIENDGDVDTFMQVILKFKADVRNPEITKDDKYVRILGTFTKEDVINIDMIKQIVTKNGENAMNLVDRTSYFTSCNLSVGGNYIGFGAEDGVDYMSVTVYYNKLYMGV